jgi:uncharacterized HAD superfamily protein
MPSSPTPAVYVDYDDVLTETARAALELAATRFGKRLTFDRIHQFDLGESFGLGSAELAELMDALHSSDVLLAMRAVPGAIESLAAWGRAGLAVQIVTGRPPSTRAASEAWLARHGVVYERLLFVDKYGRNHAADRITPMLRLEDLHDRGYALAVEDSWDMALFLAGQVGLPVALLDRPWNRAAATRTATHPNVTRCADWTRIAEIGRDIVGPARHTARACGPNRYPSENRRTHHM